MRFLVVLVLAFAGLVASPNSASSLPVDRGPASRAVTHGGWILDPAGRVLVLHGINMVYKRPPYAPDAEGFGRDDARFLARNGFTTVRLGLIWKAVEPRPGHYDLDYLARIRRTAQTLADEGIWTLLDFHQDLFNEKFQGEGAPSWAVQDDGLPAMPQLGFPYNYFAMLGLNRAFDNFWANADGPGGVGLQDRYAAAWARVTRFFRQIPKVLGVDLFNEPWPGSTWALCANPLGCPLFDAKLEAFTQRSIDAIRRVDKRTAVFYEPHVLFNNGAQTGLDPTGQRLGFSFHDYCLTADLGLGETGGPDPVCGTFDDLVWSNTAAHVAATGHPPLLTEFGATKDQATLKDMVGRAEAAMTGWQYWAYCGCDDPTTTGPGATQALVLDPAKPPAGDNVDWAKMRALVVPHPLAVAGTPTAYHFQRGNLVFRAAWSVARAGRAGHFGSGSRTSISVPHRVYRHGYVAHVRGGRVVSAPDARTLVVAQGDHARQVHVVVRPR
ncbi:cellulase family glycosylhydrolase [Nocardioides sp.]|uniref:cellulase family glycosylhydrolase n=1 Tax=Nocardioides sp. TaxID=35761 RepID=UPI0031FF254F|nr:endoglycoceramidase [Nocardioides sp.]